MGFLVASRSRLNRCFPLFVQLLELEYMHNNYFLRIHALNKEWHTLECA